jgi:transcriptional regulator with XRE-family HTH domain
MKIKISRRAPDDVQRFFSAPLSFRQKVTVKKLLIVEQILERMKSLGLNRTKLAEKMEVSPARITTMMDGTNNFTIETLMRAADAVDCELALGIVPKGRQVKWITYHESDVHTSFLPAKQPIAEAPTHFILSEPLGQDEAHAA